MRQLILLSFAFALLPNMSAGITGRVVDEKGFPVEFANIIYLDSDSTIVETGISAEDGTFNCSKENIKTILIKAMGFQALQLDNVNSSELGEITLNYAESQLDDLLVVANRPIMYLEGNDLVTKIEGTNLSKLSSANELLGWIPTVSGENGRFIVFGKGEATIYINGRKMTDASELSQISGHEIRDIKVISSPGPHYEASANAVILITTLQNKEEGIGMYARSWSCFSNYFSQRGWYNLKYRKKNLDIALLGNAEYGKMRFNTDETETILMAEPYSHALDQRAVNTTTSYEGKAMINYQINELNSFGGFYSLRLNKTYIRTFLTSEETRESVFIDKLHTDAAYNTDFYPTHNSNIYYNSTVGNIHIDTNLDFTAQSNTTTTHNHETSVVSEDRLVTTRATNSTSLFAEKLSCRYEFRRASLTVGEELTMFRMQMDYKNIEGIISDSRSVINETNLAFFSQYIQTLTSNISLSAGVRYEHITHRYGENQSRITRHLYDDFLPYASVNATFENIRVGLTYSNTIKRPRYSQLDGAVYYANRFEYRQGNPTLKSTRSSSMEINSQYNSYFLKAVYTQTINPVMFSSEISSTDNDIVISTYKNGGTARSFDALIGISKSIAFIDIQASAGLNKPWFKSEFNGSMKRFDKLSGEFSCNITLRMPFKFRIMADFTYNTRYNWLNTYVYSEKIFNVVLAKSFFEDSIEVTIRGRDLFNGLDRKSCDYHNAIVNFHTEKMNMRALTFSISYSLNPRKDRYKGTGAGNNEKNRM